MTEPPAAVEEARLPALTGLRWYAALLVFVHHLDIEVGWGPAGYFFWGFTGVTFFFVLSGFVLTWGYRPGNFRGFMFRRAARIYPAHLIMWLVALPLLGILDKKFEVLPAILNALLLQAWFGEGDFAFSMNSPSWSLSCEIAFYASLPLMWRQLVRRTSRQRWMVAAFALGVAAFITASTLVLFDQHWAYNNPAVRSAEFVLGVVLALEVRDGWRPRIPMWRVFAALAIGATVTQTVVPGAVLDTYVMVAPFAALVVVTAITRNQLTGFLGNRASVYLGDVSFAFYLVHFIAINAVLEWTNLTATASAGLSLVVSFVGAVTLHHVIEKPARAWLLARAPQSQPLAPADT